jgi:alpha-glucoside transport system substrate-binding protein
MRWNKMCVSFLVLASLLLIVPLIAGCGSSKKTTTPTPSGSVVPQVTGTPFKAGAVSVLGIWGDGELDDFNEMVAPWQTDTGGTVNFTGSRNITADLTLNVTGGHPPDIAIPAETGLLQQFASQGKLSPLSDCPGLEEAVKADYPSAFQDIGTVNGTLYALVMKVDSKATVWYNPKTFSDMGFKTLDTSNTFQDLINLSDQIKAAGLAPWSMGMQAGTGADGFPGMDWIDQLILTDYGPSVYDGFIDGSIPFTDSRMADAWKQFSQIALTSGYVVQGDAAAINATNFQNAAYPPFATPPTAAMVYEGSFASGFITGQFPSAVPGTDFNFFNWPGGGNAGVTGGANVVYMFNSNPSTCSLMSWLESAQAQEIWVKLGGFHSVNKKVDLNAYPDSVEKAVAQQLQNADPFRFSLDDAIGGAEEQAMFAGVLQYLSDPSSLDSVLSGIEAQRGS